MRLYSCNAVYSLSFCIVAHLFCLMHLLWISYFSSTLNCMALNSLEARLCWSAIKKLAYHSLYWAQAVKLYVCTLYRVQAMQSRAGEWSYNAPDSCLRGAAAAGQWDTVTSEGGTQDVAVLWWRQGRGSLDQGTDHVVTGSWTWLDKHTIAAHQAQGLIMSLHYNKSSTSLCLNFTIAFVTID